MRVFCKIPPGRKKNFLIGTETDREALLEQMGKLACAKVNDAVKLAYLPEEEREAIGRLDLSALTEFRRSGAGTVEMKFTDRMRALERLLELSGPGGEEQLERFHAALEGLRAAGHDPGKVHFQGSYGGEELEYITASGTIG